jgi:hypothetical protein
MFMNKETGDMALSLAGTDEFLFIARETEGVARRSFM